MKHQPLSDNAQRVESDPPERDATTINLTCKHCGTTIAANDDDEPAERSARVLHNDPATGGRGQAVAGYQVDIEVDNGQGLNLPMVNS